MKKRVTKKIRDALVKAYRTGAISLSGVCPHCFDYMGAFSHGICERCKKYCGCSFNPTSSSDHCEFHCP